VSPSGLLPSGVYRLGRLEATAEPEVTSAAKVHGHPWPCCEPAADLKYPSDALRPLSLEARANLAGPGSRAARELECLPSPASFSHLVGVFLCIRVRNTRSASKFDFGQ
jgi:hypothetical protein